jgi:hypothetical protein
MWLSAANAWTGAARGFWTAELRRQQTTMINEMSRQTMRFWADVWAMPGSARRTTKRG